MHYFLKVFILHNVFPFIIYKYFSKVTSSNNVWYLVSNLQNVCIINVLYLNFTIFIDNFEHLWFVCNHFLCFPLSSQVNQLFIAHFACVYIHQYIKRSIITCKYFIIFFVCNFKFIYCLNVIFIFDNCFIWIRNLI